MNIYLKVGKYLGIIILLFLILQGAFYLMNQKSSVLNIFGLTVIIMEIVYVITSGFKKLKKFLN